MMSASESTPTLGSWLVFNPNREAVVERLRELAPYAALLALPGGSLLTLWLWLYRRQKNGVVPF